MAYAQFRERLIEMRKFIPSAFQTFYTDLGTIMALDLIHGKISPEFEKQHLTAEALIGVTPWGPPLTSSMFGTIAFNVLRKNRLSFEYHEIVQPVGVRRFLKFHGLEPRTGRLLAALGTAVTLDRDVHQHGPKPDQFELDIPIPHIPDTLWIQMTPKEFLSQIEVAVDNDEQKRIVMGIAAAIFLWISTHGTEMEAERIYNQLIKDHGEDSRLLQILEVADLPPASLNGMFV